MYTALVLFLLVVGCSPGHNPHILPVAVPAMAAPDTTYWFIRPTRIQPREWYVEEYLSVLDCTGEGIRPEATAFNQIEWVGAEAILEIPTGRLVFGLWQAPHRIWLDLRYVNSLEVVRHELTHEALGENYPHDNFTFLRCSALPGT